LFSLYIKI